MELSNASYRQPSHLGSNGLLWDILCSLSPDKIESPIIRVVPFFHLPSSRVSRILVSSSNFYASYFLFSMLLLNFCTLSRKDLHSFIRSLRMVTLLMLYIALSSLIAVMLASVMLSKLLLGWVVISSCLIVLSTSFTFLCMHHRSYYWRWCRGYLH